MTWAKVNKKHRKPLKWWYHKVLCEYGWTIRYKDSWETYYHHLDMCCKQGFNLYGEEFNRGLKRKE